MTDTLPFGKDAKPEYPEVEQRRPLNKWEFATLMLQQQGKCAKCGERLQRGKVRNVCARRRAKAPSSLFARAAFRNAQRRTSGQKEGSGNDTRR